MHDLLWQGRKPSKHTRSLTLRFRSHRHMQQSPLRADRYIATVPSRTVTTPPPIQMASESDVT